VAQERREGNLFLGKERDQGVAEVLGECSAGDGIQSLLTTMEQDFLNQDFLEIESK
jgi:hypothetical protein